MFFHSDRKKQYTKSTLECILIIEKLCYIFTLYGSKCCTCGVTYINTFLHTAYCNLFCILILRNISEIPADNSTET